MSRSSSACRCQDRAPIMLLLFKAFAYVDLLTKHFRELRQVGIWQWA